MKTQFHCLNHFHSSIKKVKTYFLNILFIEDFPYAFCYYSSSVFTKCLQKIPLGILVFNYLLFLHGLSCSYRWDVESKVSWKPDSLTVIQQFSFQFFENKVENYELFLKSPDIVFSKNPLHPSKGFIYCHIQTAGILSCSDYCQNSLKSAENCVNSKTLYWKIELGFPALC